MVIYLTVINPDKSKGMLWASTEGFLAASKYGRRCHTERQKNKASLCLSFSSFRATNVLTESVVFFKDCVHDFIFIYYFLICISVSDLVPSPFWLFEEPIRVIKLTEAVG